LEILASLHAAAAQLESVTVKQAVCDALLEKLLVHQDTDEISKTMKPAPADNWLVVGNYTLDFRTKVLIKKERSTRRVGSNCNPNRSGRLLAPDYLCSLPIAGGKYERN
jgi:hypothetical protein